MLNSNFLPGRLNLGDTIEFTPKYHKTAIQAVVVDITRWAHCIGASEFKCYSTETNVIYGLDLLGGNYKVVAQAQTEEESQAQVEKVRQAYKAHLDQYPVWHARFQAGGSVSF